MSKIKKKYLDFEVYEKSEVTTISGDITGQIVTDHGALTGLTDDDHSLYLLADGTRELTGNWNVGNYNVGINTAPSYPLHIVSAPGDETHRGILLDYNPTGTHTGGKYLYGMYIDVDSDADEDTYVSTLSSLRLNLRSSGEINTLQGIDNSVVHNSVDTINSIQGCVNDASIWNGHAEFIYGARNLANVITSGDAGIGYGTYSSVFMNVDGNTLSTAYSHYSGIIQNAGTLSTGYLYYGLYTGTVGTKWGIYLDGEDQNYFSGMVGIGVTPSYPLHLSYSPGDVDGKASFIDLNPTGTHTANRMIYGLDIDIDSDADEDTFSSRIYGINLSIYSAGEINSLYGGYNTVFHGGVDTINLIAGQYNYSGIVGGTVSTLYGAFNSAAVATSGNALSAYGSHNTVQMNASGQTLTTAYGLNAVITQTAGTITTGYMLRGLYSGTVGTKWGIHLSGETKNYFSGNVGIGVTSPSAKLDVNGDLILELGTTINEFSTDTTLSGDSDTAVPTEKAVKTYVDNTVPKNVDSYGGLEAAITAIGAVEKTVVVTTTQTLAADLTIPATLSVIVLKECIISGAHTLTVSGSFSAGLYQVFDSSITVNFGNGAIKEVYPQWWGAKGDGTTNDTVAINKANASLNITYQQYGQTADNQVTLHFPSGIYRVTPDGLDYIQGNIYGPDAVFQPSEDSSGHILHIRQIQRYGFVNIRGIMGFNCTFLSHQNPTRDAHTIGIRITNTDSCQFNIGQMVGLKVAVFLDSFYDSVNSPTSSNYFNIGRMMWNEIGIIQRTGTGADTGRSEGNRFVINYMVAHEYAIWLDATTNSGGKIQDNYYNISVLETHYAANEIGIYITGALNFNNKFDVLQVTNPTGTGKLVLNGDGVNNIINIPVSDWSLIEFGNNYNIWNTQIRSKIEGTAAPVSGRWRQGDIVWNTSASSGQAVGWICTAAGTPGTWNSFGPIGTGTTATWPTLIVSGLPVHANNASAVSAGLAAGRLYRTNSDPDTLCVVH